MNISKVTNSFLGRLSLAFCLTVILVYSFKFNFAYTPVTEGWFIAYGLAMNQGAKLWVDLPLNLTPLYVLLSRYFSGLFGYGILEFRWLGMMLIFLHSLVLYHLLRLFGGVAISSLLTVFGIIYFQSGNAYISYDFTQFLSLFSVTSIFFILKSEDLGARSKLLPYYSIFIGLSSSAAFLIKQSNGSFILAASMIAVLFSSSLSWRHILLCYLSAAGLCFATLALCLDIKDFSVFFYQIFDEAMGVKGGSGKIFHGWMEGLLTPTLLKQLQMIISSAIVLIVSALLLNALSKNLRVVGSDLTDNVCAIVACFYIFLLALRVIDPFTSFVNEGASLRNLLIPLNVIVIALLLIEVVSRKVFAVETIRLRHPLQLALLLVALTVGNGTSAGLSEISAYLGVCIGLAVFFAALPNRLVANSCICLFVLATTSLFIDRKFSVPYEWWGVKARPVSESQLLVEVGPFAGLTTDSNTHRMLDRVNSFFSKETSVYGFPHTVLPLLITNQRSFGPVVQWFDFMSDERAKAECARLTINLPSKVMFIELPEYAWTKHEELFRGGRRVGQRCFNEIFGSDAYLTVDTFTSGESRIKLLKRKEEQEEDN